MTTPNNRVSGGRNMNHEPVCKTCPHLKADPGRWGGWCQHPSNRVIDESWPQGFTPSQGSDGGCDLHPAHVSGVMASDDSQLDDAVTVAMFKAASQVKDNPVTRDVPSGKLHEFLMAFARALGVGPTEPQQEK